MAMFHGKAGKVVWNAEDGASDVDISNVLSWTLDATGDTAETTAMAAVGNWKTFLGGFKTWTATVECNAESTGPEVLYTTVGANDGLVDGLEVDGIQKVFIELWFTQDPLDGLVYGPAIATGISLNQDANDVTKVSYTFQGQGELLFKTAEPGDFIEPLGSV